MPTLGALVFSLSGMKHLARCLESVQWADAVTVLHVGGGEPLLQRPPSSSIRIQRMSHLEDSGWVSPGLETDWILHLWGEEAVGAELKEELLVLCRSEVGKAPLSYRIPIRSLVLGCWVEGSLWGPSPSLRLCRTARDLSSGWWDERERTFREPSGLLRGRIGDYACVELRDALGRINGVSDFWAGLLRAKSQIPGPWAMALHPLRVFIRLLWMNGLFSAGLSGLTLSLLAAYATLASGAKLWEARNVRRERGV